jgi:hypothetical protein
MALRALSLFSGEIHVDLRFLADRPEYQVSKPYYISGPLPNDLEIPRTNIEYETLQRLRLTNLRGKEDRLSLSEHGFQILHVSTSVTDLDVRGVHRADYISAMVDLVKSTLRATFALCYDCKVC